MGASGPEIVAVLDGQTRGLQEPRPPFVDPVLEHVDHAARRQQAHAHTRLIRVGGFGQQGQTLVRDAPRCVEVPLQAETTGVTRQRLRDRVGRSDLTKLGERLVPVRERLLTLTELESRVGEQRERDGRRRGLAERERGVASPLQKLHRALVAA